MAAPAPPAEADRISPITDAVADMRTTAKWTIAAVAASGTLLLGGAPLAAVGKINDLGDATAAFAGLTIALAGVGWAIWQTSEVLIPRIAILPQLAHPQLAALKDTIAQDPTAFYGPFGHNPQQLRAARVLHETTATNLSAALARETDQARSRVLEQALSDARANAELAQRLETRLLELIHAWQVHTKVQRARVHTIAAVAVVALGAVMFLTATNDNKPTFPVKPAPASSQLPPP